MRRHAIGFFVGAWAGAVLVALLSIAFDTSFNADDLVGGYRLKAASILVYAVFAAIVGGMIGAILGGMGTPARMTIVKTLDD